MFNKYFCRLRLLASYLQTSIHVQESLSNKATLFAKKLWPHWKKGDLRWEGEVNTSIVVAAKIDDHGLYWQWPLWEGPLYLELAPVGEVRCRLWRISTLFNIMCLCVLLMYTGGSVKILASIWYWSCWLCLNVTCLTKVMKVSWPKRPTLLHVLVVLICMICPCRIQYSIHGISVLVHLDTCTSMV